MATEPTNERNQRATVVTMYGAAGGQGTTVAAVVTASHVAQRGQRVLLLDYRGDVAAAVGTATDPDSPTSSDFETPETFERATTPVAWNLFMLSYRHGDFLRQGEPGNVRSALAAARSLYDFIIVDAGSLGSYEATAVYSELSGADERILVCAGSYPSLRRAVHDPMTSAMSGLVVVEESGRPLGAREVADVLQRPVIDVMERAVHVSRANDAGVLITRTPDGLLETLGNYMLDKHAKWEESA